MTSSSSSYDIAAEVGDADVMKLWWLTLTWRRRMWQMEGKGFADVGSFWRAVRFRTATHERHADIIVLRHSHVIKWGAVIGHHDETSKDLT